MTRTLPPARTRACPQSVCGWSGLILGLWCVGTSSLMSSGMDDAAGGEVPRLFADATGERGPGPLSSSEFCQMTSHPTFTRTAGHGEGALLFGRWRL